MIAGWAILSILLTVSALKRPPSGWETLSEVLELLVELLIAFHFQVGFACCKGFLTLKIKKNQFSNSTNGRFDCVTSVDFKLKTSVD